MTNSIDQQFVEYIVKAVVGNPDAVSIKRSIDEKGVLLELTVDPEDLGRVIGKRGSGAQALRTLLRALGTKNDARYNLKIVDVSEGRDRPERRERPERNDREENRSEEPTKKPVEEPKQAKEEPIESAEEPKEETIGSSFDKTRQELADLDDLDI